MSSPALAVQSDRLLRTLVDTAENPVPPGAELTDVVTCDGLSLRTVTWRQPASCRGTVLILQGRAEFIEKYFETIDEFLERGFSVVAFDWRGQGGSGRRVADASKGHVGDFAEYRIDLAAIGHYLRQADLPAPVTAIAHSMGGAVALAAARDGMLPAALLVALAPMIDLKMVKHPRTVRLIIRVLAALGHGARFVPGGNGRSISTGTFLGNRLSADPVRYARNAEVAHRLGPGAVGAPTIGWLAAAYRAMARLQEPDFAPGIAIPVLILAAGDDPVCLTAAAERFGEGLPRGPTLVIGRSRHEILMEVDAVRSQFWTAFDAFAGNRSLAEDA